MFGFLLEWTIRLVLVIVLIVESSVVRWLCRVVVLVVVLLRFFFGRVRVFCSRRFRFLFRWFGVGGVLCMFRRDIYYLYSIYVWVYGVYKMGWRVIC